MSCGKAPFEKRSATFRRSEAVDGVCAASRRSSHVHPSRCAADFFGIPAKAYVTAFGEMQIAGGFTLGTCTWMCVCLDVSVSFARTLPAISGSVSSP